MFLFLAFQLYVRQQFMFMFQVAVVFQAERVVEAAAASPRLDIQADGTFRVVPRLFQQLCVIFVSTNGRMLPAYFALMTSRTRGLYEAVFSECARRLGQPAERIMADWETALQGAAAAVWPEAQVNGCWFHYAQAVLRKVSQCLSHSYIGYQPTPYEKCENELQHNASM